jgi:hypothetical protein
MPSLSRVQSDAPRFSAAVVTMVGLLAVVVVVPVSMIAAGDTDPGAVVAR